MHEQKIYDPSILRSLVGDEEELISQYKLEYYQQAIKSIKQIALLYNQSDFNALKEEAHFLKTSAKAVGALACSDSLQAIENASLQQDKPALHSLIMQLKTDIINFKQVVTG